MWSFIGIILFPIAIYIDQKNRDININGYSVRMSKKYLILYTLPKFLFWLWCLSFYFFEYDIRRLYILCLLFLIEIISVIYQTKEIRKIIDDTFEDEILRTQLKKDSEFKSYWVIGVYTLILILLGITLLNK